MLPCLSAASPCGPESGVFSGYSLKFPSLVSSRPSLFAICSVTQSAPSGATAGSCGLACGVGTSYSLIATFSVSTAAKAAMEKAINKNQGLRRDMLTSSLRCEWRLRIHD